VTSLPVNQVLTGHAREVMANWPSNSVDLIVTSPPYFDLVKYEGGLPWRTYAEFLDDIIGVWIEAARVLRPNGKLAINVMMVPIAQTREAKRRNEPRQLYDLAHDFQQRILVETDLRLFEKFIWAKQTTERMQGAYPTAALFETSRYLFGSPENERSSCILQSQQSIRQNRPAASRVLFCLYASGKV
jgi:DNA modification methylase